MTQVLASRHPLSRRLAGCGRGPIAVLAGLFAVACSSAPAPKTAVPEPAHVPSLVQGVLEEHELASGSKDVYELRLEAESYLELTVEQTEADVVVTLAGPEDSTIVSVDDPGVDCSERLAVIVPATGTYRLTIAPFESEAPRGHYRVKLRELRPARSGDAERVAAETLYKEGQAARFKPPIDKPKALDRYREALAGWLAAGDTSGQVRAMVGLGETECDQLPSAEAAGWLKKALGLAGPGDPEERARAHFALAAIGSAEATGDGWQAAVEHLRQASEIWKQSGYVGSQGKALLEMGINQLNLNQPDAAFESLQEAVPLLREARDDVREARAFISLQGVYLRRGEIGEAFRYVSQGLELARHAGARPEEASALYNLSNIYKLRGELQKALDCLNRALEINRELKDRPRQALTLYALGSVYHDLGDLEKALEEYELSKQLRQTVEPGLLYNIGWILFRQDKPQEALGYFQQALLASREQKKPEMTASALHNLGVAEVSQGRLQEGLDFLRQALELRQNKNPFPWAQTLRELGTAYDRLGDTDLAARYFGESLEIGRRIGAPGLVAEALYRWALLDRKKGQLEAGLERIGEAIQLVESLRSAVEADDLRTAFFASKRQYYELYIDLLMRLYQAHPQGPYLKDALEVSERARSRGLLDLLDKAKIELQQGIAPELQRKETELSSRLSWLLGQTASEGSLGPQISQTEEAMSRLALEVRDQSPRYAELRFPEPLDLAGTRQLLDEDTALFEYFVGRESSALFVVTREGLTGYPLPSEPEISALVQKVRALVERPAGLDLGEFRRQSARLYELLLGPAREILAHKHSLIIAADGPLYVFPFEALLKQESRGLPLPQLPYLLSDHAVSYVSSASVLKGLRESKRGEEPGGGPSKAFVAFADPLSGPAPEPKPESSTRGVAAVSPESSLPRLAYSAQEVDGIASLFSHDQVKLYLGSEATRDNVLGNPLVEGAQRVHFATHGYVDEAKPELSALILTPSGGQHSDLTVADIFNMKLRADLVVLSACRTALGKEVSGEGMVGLTRAFLYAGAKTLVVSLWPVVDRTTADLMQAFYRSLGTAAGKAEALRHAKLDMIRNGQADPYLWAPFILSGEPR